MPQAVVFPRNADDLVRIARLSGDPRFSGVTFAPRGGGTGTNGQSLTDGLVVDVSRHMNAILEINVEERWARVQPGVVKDQLNVRPGRTRPVLRAGTVAVQPRDDRRHDRDRRERPGLLLYGKTRDHVLELKTVLLDGTLWQFVPAGRRANSRETSAGPTASAPCTAWSIASSATTRS